MTGNFPPWTDSAKASIVITRRRGEVHNFRLLSGLDPGFVTLYQFRRGAIVTRGYKSRKRLGDSDHLLYSK